MALSSFYYKDTKYYVVRMFACTFVWRDSVKFENAEYFFSVFTIDNEQ